LKIASWNIRGLGTNEIELDKELKEKKIYNAIIGETKEVEAKENKGSCEICCCSCAVEQKRSAISGVAILIDQKRKNKIEMYFYVYDTI
jgi:exonuclease III